MNFIDGPSPTASKEAWEKWLAELEKMNKQDETVLLCIARAQRIIASFDDVDTA